MDVFVLDNNCIVSSPVYSYLNDHPTQPLKHRHRIYDDQGTQGATVPPPRIRVFSPPLPGTAVGDPASTDAAEAPPIGAVTADRRDRQHEQGETPHEQAALARAAASSLAADPMGSPSPRPTGPGINVFLGCLGLLIGGAEVKQF
ncbi:hypothetical protein FQR65_LT20026 [Abscondita terminalis]|nr:hypothetical protein FQR65_LT20026 [Abscondita terminalis]